jgi:hypothetical protein
VLFVCLLVLQMNGMVSTTEETAIPVSEVVQVIVEAATAAQPKVRIAGMPVLDCRLIPTHLVAVCCVLLPQPVYLVGKDATLNYVLKRLLPDQAWINFTLKALGQ